MMSRSAFVQGNPQLYASGITMSFWGLYAGNLAVVWPQLRQLSTVENWISVASSWSWWRTTREMSHNRAGQSMKISILSPANWGLPKLAFNGRWTDLSGDRRQFQERFVDARKQPVLRQRRRSE